jgi:hypothetical protein
MIIIEKKKKRWHLISIEKNDQISVWILKKKWEVDYKNGCVYEKENKLNTIVNEESEVRGKKHFIVPWFCPM